MNKIRNFNFPYVQSFALRKKDQNKKKNERKRKVQSRS